MSAFIVILLLVAVFLLLSQSRKKSDTITCLKSETSRLSGQLESASSDLRRVLSRFEDSREQATPPSSLSDLIQLLDAACSRLCDERDRASSDLEQHINNLDTLLSSNLTAFPWLAGLMADFLTYGLEIEAKKLDWGHNIQREKKVASIREIRAAAQAKIEAAKVASYQLEYLRFLFPAIDDILGEDYGALNLNPVSSVSDPTRGYLSHEEWSALAPNARDQLALDRYVQSRQKSPWQIGRDYELSVCHEYMAKGYSVATFGSFMGVEDLGRDLIAENDSRVLIIQCKYWSQHKVIHEKHIFQLFGTATCYKLDHPDAADRVVALFVTSTKLSDMARRVALDLGIHIVENHAMADFPRIKCNIGHNGEKIYHLPMDAQYDVTQIKLPGEFYAYTVDEAVQKGFRRAYRRHGSG